MSSTTKYAFQCVEGCGQCCRGNGYLACTKKELDAIVDYLGHTTEYTPILLGNGVTVYDLETVVGETVETCRCKFLVDNKCSIYPVRPYQCRTYPFWKCITRSDEAWNKECEKCPGMRKVQSDNHN